MASDHIKHWSLDPEFVHLNHGSFGACPNVVIEAQQRWLQQLELRPTAFMSTLESKLDVVRATLADLVGAEPNNLVFVQNTTTAVNAVLQSKRLEPGDEILITSYGYNACNNVAQFAAQRAGARVVTAEMPFPLTSSDQAVAAIVEAATDNTRIALLDHVTSATALVLPIAKISAALAARGIEVLVDGAHAPGMLELDIQKLMASGVTYYAGNLHKWLCAAKGTAFLVVKPERQQAVRPTVISHGANSSRTDRSRFLMEFDWPGTFDPSPVLTVPTAIEFIRNLLPGGLPALFKRNRDLALQGRAYLCDRFDLEVAAPSDMIGSMATMVIPPDPLPCSSPFPFAELMVDLVDKHRVQVLSLNWPLYPSRILRISTHLYNDMRDIERLGDALEAELAAKARTTRATK